MDRLRHLAHVVPQSWRNRLRAWQLRTAATWRRVPGVGASLHDLAARRPMDCRLCLAVQSRHTLIGPVPLTHTGPFAQRDYRLVHCEECDAVYLDPLPADADLKTLYVDSVQFSGERYSHPAQAVRTLQAYQRRIELLGLLPAAGDAMLEIGAGLAWMSRACKAREPRVFTVAQDVSGECANACPWVDDYRVGPIETVPESASFAFVSMTHVIEHLVDPVAMLAQVAARTRPGGAVYITAPFRPPLWRARDGLAPWLSYSYLHVPAHVQYVSERWFRQVLPPCGLELMRWDASHDGHQVFEALLRRR